jgi:timeless
LDSVANSGNVNEAELFDDLTELEVDNHEKDGQRIIGDGNIAESGEITNSDSNGRAGLKRRHRLVIDDDDDE